MKWKQKRNGKENINKMKWKHKKWKLKLNLSSYTFETQSIFLHLLQRSSLRGNKTKIKEKPAIIKDLVMFSCSISHENPSSKLSERERTKWSGTCMRERIYGYNVCLDFGQRIDDIELVYWFRFGYWNGLINSVTTFLYL